MKANVEPLEGNKVKLSVELDESEVNKALDAAFRRIAREVNVPGFRPGKAPRKLIEARVGAEAARAQALSDAIPGYYVQALRETDTDAVNRPEVNIVEGEKEGSTVTFEAEVETRPVPALHGYQNLKVTVSNPEPSEEHVDAQIERMRRQFGELEAVERAAQKGDFVTIDVEGLHEEEAVPGLTASDYSYEVGSGLQSLGERFDSEVEGSSAGAVLDFVSPVPPDDEEVTFHVEVKQVQERTLPDLTDEWANEVSEFETVDELKADIANRIREVRTAESVGALRTGVIEAVAQLVDEEIPEVLIDTEMQRVLRDFVHRLEQQGANLAQYLEASGQSQEEFVASIRGNATDSVRADLALRALGEKEAIEVSEAEVEAEVQLLAKQLGQKVAAVRRDIERAGQLPAVRSDISKAKAVEWLMDHVEIVDADGHSIDRELLRPEHHGHDHQEGETEA